MSAATPSSAAPACRSSPDPFALENHATVLAHENVLRRMSAPTGSQSPFPTKMWPTETFTSRFRSMYINDDAVQVIRQTGARSDSDIMVLFRKADVVVTGDIVDLRQFPVIDRARGGSIQRELEALNRLLTEFVVPNIPQVLKPGGTLVVPGHGYVSDYGEVVEYRDMLTVDHRHHPEPDREGHDARSGEGRQSHAGISRPLRIAIRDRGRRTMFVEAVYQSLKGVATAVMSPRRRCGGFATGCWRWTAFAGRARLTGSLTRWSTTHAHKHAAERPRPHRRARRRPSISPVNGSRSFRKTGAGG